MSHHTKQCRIGECRIRKNFVWFSFCRGYMVFFEDIIVEQEYREKPAWGFLVDEAIDYHWKTTKKWTVEDFEKRHGPFLENYSEKNNANV